MVIFLLILFLTNKLQAQVMIPVGFWQCHSATTVNSSTDSTNANFTAGTLSNTIVTGSTVSLAVAATSGTFTSQTVDILQSCISFNSFLNFSWKTSLPFLKELPTTTESIVDYSSVLTTLQTSLLGYWRLNETSVGSAPGGTDFQDFSGNGNNAVRLGTITLGASGRFLNAVSSNNSGGYVDLPGANALISNTSSYTISVWYNLSAYTNGCAGSGSYLLDRNISGSGNPLAGICTKSNSYTFESRCDNASALLDLVGGTVTLNTWQHVVIQRDRAANLYRIFTNGAQVNTAADGGGCAVTLDVFRLARHATNSSGGMTGSADEFMIWNRALSAAEILQLYRRGGNRVQFQFRACQSPTCADNPGWVGPNGTATSYFTELYNNSTQSTGLGNVLLPFPRMTFSNFGLFILPRNRYFQYRAFLNSDSTATTPDFNFIQLNW